MSELFETLARAFTSPIWFLAAVAFGTLFYFQFAIGKIQDAPKNQPCSKCDDLLHRYFPNTKFCQKCFEDLKDESDQWMKDLEAARKKVADAEDDQTKKEGYQEAIDSIEKLLALQEQFPKHGLRFSETLPVILKAAREELAELEQRV